MIEWLSLADRNVLLFVNVTLANPVGDLLWPIITHYDQLWPFRILLLGAWLWLLIRGGRKGRTVALLVIPLLLLSDQLNSFVLKPLFARPRPCHEADGLAFVRGLHMLVPCGSGMAFPSSHAVNNFALATLFSRTYPKWTWAFFTWASLVALSRVAVGVHYPSDILGGAVIGCLLALLLLAVWGWSERRLFPHASVTEGRLHA